MHNKHQSEQVKLFVWCAVIITTTRFADTGIDTWLQFRATPIVMTPLLTSLKNTSCLAGFFVFFQTDLFTQLDGQSVYCLLSPFCLRLFFTYFFFYFVSSRVNMALTPRGLMHIQTHSGLKNRATTSILHTPFLSHLEVRQTALFVFVSYFIFLFFSSFTPLQKVSKPLIGQDLMAAQQWCPASFRWEQTDFFIYFF